ncbi:gp44 protein [Galbibacter marinus]|uniref:Gp44 protein n=1 Tax=Galbibacter marinus TaxID=555500 RepID=K2Q5Y7_9FLAO|nr:class I SAM-dependent methyltransferase [Galbibacter marinus]EKF56216.1 gp44 protein [Galbibacter marinus]
MKKDKFILDACCGSRMFWFDKSNPDVLFMDIRELEATLCDGRHLSVKPDVVGDFRNMPFPNNSFKMVVFDPPHLHKLGQDTWMAQKYGVLLPTWETDIRAGFEECMRVLEPFGTLIFKWNEVQITTNKIIEIIGKQPLFGHPSGKQGKTKWMAFMKNI